MPARRAIMVLATKQHTGKTSVSLALIQTARKLLAPFARQPHTSRLQPLPYLSLCLSVSLSLCPSAQAGAGAGSALALCVL